MRAEQRKLTQPPDWWLAFEEAAHSEGKGLSQWLGEAGKRHLPIALREVLSERRSAGRPSFKKKGEDE